MVNTSLHLLPPKRQALFTFLIVLVLACSVAGCSAVNQLQATATPTATATNTPTPTPTNTATPTPTPTIIPPPQGEWSQYWDSNQMYELLIDGEGYLWGRGVTTIIRWNLRDGTYQEFGTSDGLPDFTADKMFLGPSGEVWLYFRDIGLYQFDDPDWMAYFEQDEIKGYRLDATALGPDGTLWVCTNASLSRFDGQEWFSLQVEGGIEEGYCEYLTVDLQGNPWMQGEYGVAIYDEPDWINWDIEGVDFDYDDPQGAYTAPNGTIWFAYGGEGMLWFDGTYWQKNNIKPKDFDITSYGKAYLLQDGSFLNPDQLTEYKYGIHVHVDFESGGDSMIVEGWHWNVPFAHEMPVEKIAEMYSGVNNDLWLVYKKGLIHVAGETLDQIPIEGMTSATQLNDLEISRYGQIYLALDDAIYKFTGDQTQPLLTDSELVGNHISKLALDANGTLWLVSNRGLQSYDGQTWSKPDLPGARVKDLVRGPEGEIWVYHNPYLSRWDGSSWTSYNSQELEDLPSKAIYDLFVDHKGTLWIAYSKDNYLSFDGTEWTSYPLDEETEFGYIRDIARDQTGTVYLIGSQGGDTHLFWEDDQDWVSQVLDSSAEAFRRHPSGELWLLLREGEIFKLANGTLDPVDLENPAPDASIYDLTFGPDGSIWLATSQGAFRYDNHNWESYTAEDGLREDRVTNITVGPDGSVWFGGAVLTRLGPP